MLADSTPALVIPDCTDSNIGEPWCPSIGPDRLLMSELALSLLAFITDGDVTFLVPGLRGFTSWAVAMNSWRPSVDR